MSENNSPLHPTKGRKKSRPQRGRRKARVPIADLEKGKGDIEESERSKRRKYFFLCAICCIVLIVVITLLVVFLGKSDKKDEESTSTTETCDVLAYTSNGKPPETFDTYQCDLISALYGNENTWLASLKADTPQGRAFAWMTDEDNGFDILRTPQRLILERFVMSTIYFATDGVAWYNKYDFLSDKSVCDWGDKNVNNIRCTRNNTISDIDLPQNGLLGKIPAEIAFLKDLRRFYVSFNELSGTLPTHFGEIKGLKSLYLNDNEFTGTIPSELDSLSNLVNLYLHGNKLSGSLNPLCSILDAMDNNYYISADCATRNLQCDCCEKCL